MLKNFLLGHVSNCRLGLGKVKVRVGLGTVASYTIGMYKLRIRVCVIHRIRACVKLPVRVGLSKG